MKQGCFWAALLILIILPISVADNASQSALEEGYHDPLFVNSMAPYLNESAPGSTEEILTWEGKRFEIGNAQAGLRVANTNLEVLTTSGSNVSLAPSGDNKVMVTSSGVGINTDSIAGELNVNGSIGMGGGSIGPGADTTAVALGDDAQVNGSRGSIALGRNVLADGNSSIVVGDAVSAGRANTFLVGFGEDELRVNDSGLRVRNGTNIFRFTTDKNFTDATNNELPTAKAVRNFTISQIQLRRGLPKVLDRDDTARQGQQINIDKIRARSGDGLALYDDGNEGVFVKDGGNVGVGTSTPSKQLEVTGDISLTSEGQKIRFANDDDSAIVRSDAGSSSSNSLITRSKASLDFVADVNSDGGDIIAFGTGGTTPSNGSYQDWARFSGSGSLTFQQDNTGPVADQVIAADSDGLLVGDDSASTGIFVQDGGQVAVGASAPNNQLTVNGNADFNGSVGVGTSAPNRKLDVESGGNVWTSTRSTGTGNDAGYLLGNGNNWQGSLRWADGDSELQLGTRAGNERALRIGQDNKVTVQSGNLNLNDNDVEVGGSDVGVIGGNLGVGTSSPNEKVTVKGDGVDLTGRDEGNSRMWSLQGTAASDNGILGLYEDGSERITLDSRSGQASYLNSGSNVGVGTSSPSNKLEVQDSGAIGGFGGTLSNAAFSITDGSQTMYFDNNEIYSDQSFKIGAEGSNSLRFGTAGSERARIDPSGNVAVGTTSADNLLTVAGDADVTGKLGINESSPSYAVDVKGDINTDSSLRTANTTRVDAAGKFFAAGGQGYSFVGDADTSVRRPTGDTITFRTTGSERIRIDSSGNLAVGTTSAENLLTVAGNADVTGKLGINESSPQVPLDVGGAVETGTSDASSGDATAVALGANTQATGDTGATALGYDTTTSGNNGAVALGRGITAAGQSSVAIGLNDQTGTTLSSPNTMAVMGGSVGIGTTTPTSLLNVDGYAELGLGTSVNEFSTDFNLSDNSDDALPTERAVKEYAKRNIRKDACSGNYTYLDGEGMCTDFRTASPNFFHGAMIQTNTVDNSEIENSDAFTFNGVTLNADLNMNGNIVNNADDVETNDIYDDDSNFLRVQDSIDLDHNDEKAIDFDGGDAMVTVHDGYGDFNIKAGVDGGNNIVSGNGGSHIQMSDGGDISLLADTSSSNTFSTTAELEVSDDVNVQSAQLDLHDNDLNNVDNVYGYSGNDVIFQNRPQSKDGLYVDSGTSYFDSSIRVDVIKPRSDGTNTIVLDDSNNVDIPNGDLSFRYGTNVNEFSTDTSLGDSSDNALPTEDAVKTYVDDNDPGGKCTGPYTFLAGDDDCEDFTTDTDNFLEGDLISDNTVDSTEVDADSLAGDDLGGSNSQIDLKNTIDVNQINNLDFIDHAGTGVDMNWDDGNNYVEFEDYKSNSDWLRINNGGPVQIRDTNLDMTNENINGINSLSGAGDSISTSDELQIKNGDGSTTYFNYDDAGSQNYIRGSRLQVDTTNFDVNTDLDMQSNRVHDIGTNNVGFQSDSDLDMKNRNVLNANSVEFNNIESVNAGEIGRDNSIGYLGNWGGNGNAVLWDAYNVQDGNAISVSGGKGQDSNPTINVTPGSIKDEEIADNTVDNSEIQNADAFSFNGVTSNADIDVKSNNVDNVECLGDQCA